MYHISSSRIAVGAFYLRLIGKSEEVYEHLEPLYNDYRKVTYRGPKGWEIMHVDAFIDALLHEELVCDIALPHIQSRLKLEEAGVLAPRESVLDELLKVTIADCHSLQYRPPPPSQGPLTVSSRCRTPLGGIHYIRSFQLSVDWRAG